MQATRFDREESLDALLSGYATGALSAPLHALVASHLAIKPDNRSLVDLMETVGGLMVAEASPVPVSSRDAKLAAIFAMDDMAIDMRAGAQRSAGDRAIPAPLHRYLDGIGRPARLVNLPWKTLIPGVKECKVEDNERGEASFYWIRGGRKIPHHTHEGLEYTLVLKGAFSDVNGHYQRGDIAIGDAEVDHQPIADAGDDCFCFAVTDAPLVLTGPIGRIVQMVFRK